MMQAQTSPEVFRAMLHAEAVVALPLGYAAFVAIVLLTVAGRIVGFIVDSLVGKAASR